MMGSIKQCRLVLFCDVNFVSPSLSATMPYRYIPIYHVKIHSLEPTLDWPKYTNTHERGNWNAMSRVKTKKSVYGKPPLYTGPHNYSQIKRALGFNWGHVAISF